MNNNDKEAKRKKNRSKRQENGSDGLGEWGSFQHENKTTTSDGYFVRNRLDKNIDAASA